MECEHLALGMHICLFETRNLLQTNKIMQVVTSSILLAINVVLTCSNKIQTSESEALAIQVYNLNDQTIPLYRKAITAKETLIRNADDPTFKESQQITRLQAQKSGGLRNFLLQNAQNMNHKDLGDAFILNLDTFPAEIRQRSPRTVDPELFRKYLLAFYKDLTDMELEELYPSDNLDSQATNSASYASKMFVLIFIRMKQVVISIVVLLAIFLPFKVDSVNVNYAHVISGLPPNSTCESRFIEMFNLTDQTIPFYKTVTMETVLATHEKNFQFQVSLESIKSVSKNFVNLREFLILYVNDQIKGRVLKSLYSFILKMYPNEIRESAPEEVHPELFRKHIVACYEEASDEALKKAFNSKPSALPSENADLHVFSFYFQAFCLPLFV
ncbi:hypothetical protein M3Y97_00731200 [Aphelenchoides bicaudatus]|nr:hypothetical protein M3Y97_00731200 [Aphelenchoides bicaudatus]